MIKIKLTNQKDYDDIFKEIEKLLKAKGVYGEMEGHSYTQVWKNLKPKKSKSDEERKAKEKEANERFARLAYGINEPAELKNGEYYLLKMEDSAKNCYMCKQPLITNCYGAARYRNNYLPLHVMCPHCTRGLARIASHTNHISDFTPTNKDDLYTTLEEAYRKAETMPSKPQTGWHTRDQDIYTIKYTDAEISVRKVADGFWGYSRCNYCRNALSGQHASSKAYVHISGFGHYGTVACLNCATNKLKQTLKPFEDLIDTYDTLVDPEFNTKGCEGCRGRARCMTRGLKEVL